MVSVEELEKCFRNDEQLLIKVVGIVRKHDDLIQLLCQDYAERLEQKERLSKGGVECQ